jgi:hypothetical protein
MLTQNLQLKVDWLWIDRTAKHSIGNTFLPEIMNIATILKDRGASAFVFLWGKAAEHWKQEMEQIANLCSTIFAGKFFLWRSCLSPNSISTCFANGGSILL